MQREEIEDVSLRIHERQLGGRLLAE